MRHGHLQIGHRQGHTQCQTAHGLIQCPVGPTDSYPALCAPPQVTAITFVALGTSLPDTFASMSAAVSEPHADNSLGNITGSNSVNVFLGLGLPWGIAALYWAFAGDEAAWRARYEPALTFSHLLSPSLTLSHPADDVA